MHVVMLPWSAFGHMIPFFQLSIAIAKAGIRVSFISTPRNIQRLPQPPPTLSSLIEFVELPFPILDGGTAGRSVFPEGAEATVDLPFENIQYLKAALDLLRQPIKQYVADTSLDWIIVDFFPHWVSEISREHGVPLVYFSVFSASSLAFIGPINTLVGDGRESNYALPESMTSPPEWIKFPSSVAGFEAKFFSSGFVPDNASGIAEGARYAKIVDSCEAVAVRRCVEYEGEYLDLLGDLLNKPVIPLGLLPPEKPERAESQRSSPWVENFKWLDGENCFKYMEHNVE